MRPAPLKGVGGGGLKSISTHGYRVFNEVTLEECSVLFRHWRSCQESSVAVWTRTWLTMMTMNKGYGILVKCCKLHLSAN